MIHNQPQDVLICRTLPTNWIDFLEAQRSRFRIFYLLDDDLKAAAETAELPAHYRTRIASFADTHMDRLIALQDRLLLPSEYLMRRYRPLNPVYLPPAALFLPPAITRPNPSNTRLFYHATASHRQDLQRISSVLVNCIKNYELSFESLIGEDTPGDLKKLKTVQARESKSWRAFRLFQRFARRHVGLAPLFDTPYNRGKSWIKFLDISAVGGVGVYSNRLPYTQIVDHGVNGLLADDDPASWERCLRHLIENPGAAQSMAENAHKTALDRGHPRHQYRIWLRLLKY